MFRARGPPVSHWCARGVARAVTFKTCGNPAGVFAHGRLCRVIIVDRGLSKHMLRWRVNVFFFLLTFLFLAWGGRYRITTGKTVSRTNGEKRFKSMNKKKNRTTCKAWKNALHTCFDQRCTVLFIGVPRLRSSCAFWGKSCFWRGTNGMC